MATNVTDFGHDREIGDSCGQERRCRSRCSHYSVVCRTKRKVDQLSQPAMCRTTLGMTPVFIHSLIHPSN